MIHSAYVDSQTVFVYKSLMDEVMKNITQELREEVDDTTLMILRKNWEKKLNESLKKLKENSQVNPPSSDHPGPDFRTKAPVRANNMTATILNHNTGKAPEVYGLRNNNDDKIPSRLKPNIVTQNPRPTPMPRPTVAVDTSSKPPSLTLTNSKLPTASTSSVIPPIRPDTHVKEQPPLPALVSTEKRKYVEDTKPKISLTFDDDLSSKELINVPNIKEILPRAPVSKKPKVNRIVQLDGGGTLTESSDVSDIDSDEYDRDKGPKPIKIIGEMTEVDNEGNIYILNKFINHGESASKNFPEDSKLKSDDDISDDDSAGQNTDNIIICGFDKLSRRKTVWKMELRNGIISLGGFDIVFNKAVGEFLF